MTAMVIFVGVHLVFSGGLSAGILVGFNMLAGRVSRPIIDLVTLKTEINKLRQSLQIISGIVDANSETTVRGQKPQLMGQISFKNVEFGYEDHTKIIQNARHERKASEDYRKQQPSIREKQHHACEAQSEFGGLCLAKAEVK